MQEEARSMVSRPYESFRDASCYRFNYRGEGIVFVGGADAPPQI